jgi:hypothetical protein
MSSRGRREPVWHACGACFPVLRQCFCLPQGACAARGPLFSPALRDRLARHFLSVIPSDDVRRPQGLGPTSLAIVRSTDGISHVPGMPPQRGSRGVLVDYTMGVPLMSAYARSLPQSYHHPQRMPDAGDALYGGDVLPVVRLPALSIAPSVPDR